MRIRYAAGLKLPDNGTLKLYQELQEARRELARRKDPGLGAGEIKDAERAVAELEADTKKSVAVLQQILETQLQLMDGRLQEMQDTVLMQMGYVVAQDMAVAGLLRGASGV